MLSPFDSKNRFAAAIDHVALRIAMLLFSILYFYVLWHSGLYSLLAGGGLFALLLLTLSLIRQRTLRIRDRLLRERIGGSIYLQNLLLLPNAKAAQSVCALLCRALDAHDEGGARMVYEGEDWLVRCAQCLPGSAAGPGDVLAAHRARTECGAQRCALACTTAFTPEAIRTAEWVDPPVRLITGRQLALAAGQQHPATDADIAAHAKQKKTPYTRARLFALAFSPAKTKRYLTCALLLLLLYLLTDSRAALVFMLVSFLLAIACSRENRKRLHL